MIATNQLFFCFNFCKKFLFTKNCKKKNFYLKRKIVDNNEIKMTTKCGVIIYNKTTKKYCLVFGRKSNKWGFPKGHQESNETDEMTAIRELHEETGYELKNDIQFNKKFHVKNNVYFEIFLENDAQILKGSSIPDSVEIEKVNWFTVSEIENLGLANCNFGLKHWILKRRYVKSLR